MANRYWVGGTGSWNTTNTTNWSDTSGGTGGVSVPTSADDVFFDANSGVGTVTVAATVTCKSLNCTGYIGTFAGSNQLSVAGSITWGTGMTLSYSGTLSITGTGTYTSNGKSRAGSTSVNGTGITVTLGDACIFTDKFTVNNGAFDTAGYSFTCRGIISTASNTRAIYLRTSTVTLTTTSDESATSFGNLGTLTFDAGTSTIVCTGAANKRVGSASTTSSLTFYNVTTTDAGFLTLDGINVFNSVTVGRTTIGRAILLTNNNQTIGTLNLNGNSPTQRVTFSSTIRNTQCTITLSSFGTSINCDFEDIAITGAAANASITRAGNLGGNSGITFPAAKTVYWNLSGTNAFTANGWASSSGGTPDVNNFPLAQDIAIVNNSSAGTGLTATTGFTLGTLDMSSRTTAFNINFGNNVSFMGSFLCGSGNTFTTNTAGSIVFIGSGSAVLQSNGKSINHDITINCKTGGSVTLADALSINNASCDLYIYGGTFDSAGYAITAGSITTLGSTSVRSVVLGTSTVTVLQSASPINFTGGTISASNSTIIFTSTGSANFVGGGNVYGNIVVAGGASTGNFTISGSNKINTLSSTRTTSYSIKITGGTTQTIQNINIVGSPTLSVYIESTNTTMFTLNRYGLWDVGANSTAGGITGNVVYTGSTPDYLTLSNANFIDLSPSLFLSF